MNTLAFVLGAVVLTQAPTDSQPTVPSANLPVEAEVPDLPTGGPVVWSPREAASAQAHARTLAQEPPRILHQAQKSAADAVGARMDEAGGIAKDALGVRPEWGPAAWQDQRDAAGYTWLHAQAVRREVHHRGKRFRARNQENLEVLRGGPGAGMALAGKDAAKRLSNGRAGAGVAVDEAQQRAQAGWSHAQQGQHAAAEALVEGTPAVAQRGQANTRQAGSDAGTWIRSGWQTLGPVPAAVWSNTWNAAGAAWTRTPGEAVRAFSAGSSSARSVATFLAAHAADPVILARQGVVHTAQYSLNKGWANGLQGGMQQAREAWSHDDPTMAVVWAASGLGRGVWFLGALAPVLMGAVAATSVHAAGTLAGVGVPLVVVLGSAGVAAGASALVLGPLAGLNVAVLGSLVTALTAGAAVGVMTAAVLAGAAWVGAAATVGAGALLSHVTGNALAMAAWPAAGGLAVGSWAVLGVLGAGWHLAGGAMHAGVLSALATLGAAATAIRAATGVALDGAWVVWLAGLQAATVPAVGLGAHLAATGVGIRRLALPPLLGVVLVASAAGQVVAGLAEGGGTLGAGVVEATARGALEGGATVGHGALAAVYAVAIGGQWAARALDLPQHKAWADFRAVEVQRSVEALQAEGLLPAGQIPRVVRVHFWGPDTGRVRFVVLRHANGQRLFLERQVDTDTCQVHWRVTSKDAMQRALGAKDNARRVPAFMMDGRCLEARAVAGGR